MTLRTFVVLVFFLPIANSSFSQSKLNFDSLIRANTSEFKGAPQFSGNGWDRILENSRKTNYVLIGEDHFIAEVPLFTQALLQSLDVDNYVCEIDQWMLDIFTSKINTLSDAQLEEWISANYNGFSFFQKKNEFALLRHLVKQKVNLVGVEQVGLMSTTILFQYLSETGKGKNKKLYEILRDSSAVSNNRFFDDQNKPFFMATPFFTETVGKLDKNGMKPDELDLVNAMLQSAEIYKTGSHRSRIKLMQSVFMKNYPQVFRGKNNLFKFGANHALKGESYIPVFDIGTTAHVLAQSENRDSYHILILPKAGNQAGFLRGTHPIDLNEEPYNALKPFFEKSSDSDWTLIDLSKIRMAVAREEFTINNPYLEKTIKGYDALIVIPFSSAAQSLR